MVVKGQSEISLQAELAAMQHIASVLESLDPAVRARVIQWAAQRTQDAAPGTPPIAVRPLTVVPPRAVPEAQDVPDEALSVTTLEELFRPVAARTPASADPTSEPVVGLLHDFVVEFQNIVRDWNVAVADSADRAGDQRASSAA